MKKNVLLGLLIISGLLLVTGCGFKNKVYECKYTKQDTGKQTIAARRFEVNNKNEIVFYELVTGFSNYGSETDGYKSYCDEMKNALENDKVKQYADSLKVSYVCNSDNNYQAVLTARYDVNKIKDIEDFKNITEYINKYKNEDQTFDKDKWKQSFFEDYYEGNYTCNF